MNTPSNRYARPDIKKSIQDHVKGLFKDFDPRSLSILMLFISILTITALLNGFAMTAFFVWWLAYSLSGFMELGTLIWKLVDERKQNSASQKQLTSILVWSNVIMFAILLISNLIRVALRTEAPTTGLTFFDWLAFSLISLSALGHIGGYLLFREWDTGLINKRTLAQNEQSIKFDTEFNNIVLSGTRQRLAQRQELYEKLSEIQSEYQGRGIPQHEIDAVLKEAKDALEIKYQTDLDGDGMIGSTPN